METPLELLENKLNELEKSLHKSFEAFKKGNINNELHNVHKSNIEPMIFNYKQVINFLRQWI